MLTFSTETAIKQLPEIPMRISESYQPVEITSEKYRLLSISGMRESLRTGMLTPVSECEKEEATTENLIQKLLKAIFG